MLRRGLLPLLALAAGALGAVLTAEQKRARCIACQHIVTELRREIDFVKAESDKVGIKWGMASALANALDPQRQCKDKEEDWGVIAEKYEFEDKAPVLDACQDLFPQMEDDLEELLQEKGNTAAELRKRCLKKVGKSKPCTALWTDDELPEKLMTKQQKIEKANQQEQVDFFPNNSRQEGVVQMDNLIQYKILRHGGGKHHPKRTDEITVNYRGTFLDGTEFDSSYSRGEPATFRVDGVIPGWTKVLMEMVRGDKWDVWLPSDHAYGAKGSGGQIGPHKALHFLVELIAIKGVDEPPPGGECSRPGSSDFEPDFDGNPPCKEESPIPDDWVEEDDGKWEPIMIENPAYTGIWPPLTKEEAAAAKAEVEAEAVAEAAKAAEAAKTEGGEL